MPFDQKDFEKILKGCEEFSANGRYKDKNRIRIKALVLLMRHSGLRIGDAVLLKRERITNGRLFLHTQKTGTPVYLPLPPVVLSALQEIGEIHPEYYFWTGTGKPKSALSVWDRTLRRLFEIAEIKNVEHNRLRNITTATALPSHSIKSPEYPVGEDDATSCAHTMTRGKVPIRFLQWQRLEICTMTLSLAKVSRCAR
jgi:integrase